MHTLELNKHKTSIIGVGLGLKVFSDYKKYHNKSYEWKNNVIQYFILSWCCILIFVHNYVIRVNSLSTYNK